VPASMSRHYGQIAVHRGRPGRAAAGERDAVRAGRRRAADASVADGLVPVERAFLGERDSFYLASVGATGWPYGQYGEGRPASCGCWTM
jgi:hypothetical protein